MSRIRIHSTSLRPTRCLPNRASGHGLRACRFLLALGALACLGCGLAGSPCLAQDSHQVPGPSPAEPPAKTPTQADAATQNEQSWKPLFDGKSLDGWKITDVGGQGDVTVDKGVVSLGMGATLTAITYAGEFPKCDYEFQMEARRVDGVDFFGTVTFPVGDAHCSLVVGGWGGSVVGISCINGVDASENETTKYVRFAKGQWYRIRIAVQRERVRAWIDDKPVVDLETAHRKLSTRVEVYLCQPLGIASWVTRSELRDLKYRPLTPERSPAAHVPPAEETGKETKQPAAEDKKTEAGGTDA